MIGAPENSHRESRGQHGAICEDRSSKVAASAVPRERDIALSLVWNVTRKVSATCPVRFVHTSLQTWRRTECGGCAIDGLRVLATVARYRR